MITSNLSVTARELVLKTHGLMSHVFIPLYPLHLLVISLKFFQHIWSPEESEESNIHEWGLGCSCLSEGGWNPYFA